MERVTEPSCSRGDLSSLKEEDRVDGQRSWGWLELELPQELTGLLSGQRQEHNFTHWHEETRRHILWQ